MSHDPRKNRSLLRADHETDLFAVSFEQSILFRVAGACIDDRDLLAIELADDIASVGDSRGLGLNEILFKTGEQFL